ncbi:MAG: GumC family protein [bacterium]
MSNSNEIRAVDSTPWSGTNTTAPAEESLNLLRYWQVVRKQLPGIIGLAITVGILALLIANSMTPIYTAKTKVSIERKLPTTGSVMNYSWITEQNYPGTQYQIIKSKSVAEKVVDNLRLWEHPFYNQKKIDSGFDWKQFVPFLKSSDPQDNQQAPEDEQVAIEKKKTSLTNQIRNGIQVDPIKDTFIVEISYSSPSPEVAALIANAVVNAYIERNLEAKFAEAKKVSEWMTESLGGISAQLDESEQQLQAYRNREGIVDTGESGASALSNQRLDELSNKLVEQRVEFNNLKILKKQADQFSKMPLSELLNTPSVYKHPTLTDIKAKEVEASRKVAELEKRYGPKHPKMIQAKVELESHRERFKALLPGVIRGISQDYEVSRQKLFALQGEYNSLKEQVREANTKEFELVRLQRDLEGNRKLRDLFLEQYKQANLSSKFESDKVRVVDIAEIPKRPSHPNKRRIISLAILLAVFIGVGLAFLIDLLDQTLKTADEISDKLGLATLGLLPILSKKAIAKGELKPERAYIMDETSNFSETIRTIRTGVMLSAIDNPHKIIMTTSAVPGEGKTTIACNLALSLSQLENTVIIDADMRRPSTRKIFDYDHQLPGISDLLTGNAQFKDVLHTVEGTKLRVITAGTIPPDPLDLLASNKFKRLLEQISKHFDRVIIDCPPVSLVSDPVLMSSLSDAVVFTVKADATNTKVVKSSIEKIRHAGGHLVGVALNQVDIKKMSKYYGYGYGKYYGSGYYSSTQDYRAA